MPNLLYEYQNQKVKWFLSLVLGVLKRILLNTNLGPGEHTVSLYDKVKEQREICVPRGFYAKKTMLGAKIPICKHF